MMKLTPDAALEALFGSRNRLLTMAVLANADGPLTGYRVAEITGLPREKVYPELRRAIAAGLVEKAASGVRLSDPDVRTLLRKRVRISVEEGALPWSFWRRTRQESERRASSLYDRLTQLPHPRPPSGWHPRNPRRFYRSPVKDQILREMRKPTSIHAE